MKKLLIAVMAVSVFALAAEAQGYRRKKSTVKAMAGSEEGPTVSGREAKVTIDQFPKTGQSSCLMAPGLQGASMIGRCYTKPRKWIVLEAKYTTYVKWQDQLTFNWHVLLETKSATENKGNKEGLPPYSYFSTSVTYSNIPGGSHAASVCLPPSYLERYGEPKAIGITIVNKNGDILGGNCESEIGGIKSGTQFWEDQSIMNAPGKDGKPMIERRQGLVDRSKTIWALVNPNDYEDVMQ
jgi:hypothetical protein